MLLFVWVVLFARAAEGLVVTIHNEWDTPVRLFWEGPDGDRVEVAQLPDNGGVARQESMVGHVFSYDVHGERHSVQVVDDFVLLAPKEVFVVCDGIEIKVFPEWSPRGASRFLELVRSRHYDGVPMHRVVPGFLAQFGIKEERPNIKDDPSRGIKFQPGYASFAGYGPDSRSAEIFFVMPGTSQRQLDAFGLSPWETPFAIVLDPTKLAKYVNEYGDMPPWGNGPDPQRIMEEGGQEYLKTEFPNLKYMGTCTIFSKDKPPIPQEQRRQRAEEREDDEFTSAAATLAEKRRHSSKKERSRLAAYGPPALLVLLACSMDYFRRRDKLRRLNAATHQAAPTTTTTKKQRKKAK